MILNENNQFIILKNQMKNHRLIKIYEFEFILRVIN